MPADRNTIREIPKSDESVVRAFYLLRCKGKSHQIVQFGNADQSRQYGGSTEIPESNNQSCHPARRQTSKKRLPSRNPVLPLCLPLALSENPPLPSIFREILKSDGSAVRRPSPSIAKKNT